MKLLAITPIYVSPEELERRQDRYTRLSPDGIKVILENLGDGPEIPHALETAADLTASEEALMARFRSADTAGIDAFLPDCILDPAVDTGDPGIMRPVLGLLKLTSHFLFGQGAGIGAIARNETIARELDRKFASYGFGRPLEGTQVLGLALEDVSDDIRWDAAVSARLEGFAADVVINGCSAVDVRAGGRRPVLVDPTAMALQLLGLAQRITGGLVATSTR